MSKSSHKQVPDMEESLKEMNFTPILIAFIAVFISLVIIFLWKKRSPSRTDILLTGLCESGKTLLFTQLIYSLNKETFTSTIENVGEYSINNKMVKIIDIPGHERLRGKFFDSYKSSARGIVFVIDSVTFQKDIRDVADFLYTILSDSTTNSIPILVLCNKQDETLAKGTTVVKNLLEKELNLVRTTRMSQLESVDNSSTKVFLGKQGKDFEFSHLNQNVDIVECSALKKDLTHLCKWFESVA